MLPLEHSATLSTFMKLRLSLRSLFCLFLSGFTVITEAAQEKFYFINIQYLCKTEEEEYLPCEIALIEYSIGKGITKKLHRFIEPGMC